MMIDNEQPHQELVKCVLVGDTAVGKTRLICARACNKHVSLSQLMTTHVPTVWAIDQYRICKDVLERSWDVVDDVNVSLRLWDTFGDHEKDRRFAYGRSDVVLLCFSITSPGSLKNCLAMWYPEIRRFCPETPVLLVGCKSDLRYMYRDQTYLSFFKDRSPFLRRTRKSDLVMPDAARAVARELGIPYYETSALTCYGVNEAFENAIRCALLARRHHRFWITNLRKVQRPLLQAPYMPPKPLPAEVLVSPSSYDDHMLSLWLNPVYNDVVLIAGNVAFASHRFLLAAASPAFLRVFTSETLEFGGRSSSDSSMASTKGDASLAEFNEDTEYLLRTADSKTLRVWDQLKRRSSCQVLPSCRKVGLVRELNHPGFESMCIKQCSEADGRGSGTQTVVRLSKLVTPLALNQCLQFVYTGNIATYSPNALQEIKQAAEFLELKELMTFVTNNISREEFLNPDVRTQYKTLIREGIEDVCIQQGLFSDVMFQLDDGYFAAHRPLLVARCDVMKAMFMGDFRESAAKVVMFPGVNEDTFLLLLQYLYTDDIPAVTPGRSVYLLELANRLCLPRLVNLTEQRVVAQLSAMSTEDVLEHCLKLLEPSQLHNAHQLADWCMNFLCTNYNKLCKHHSKLLRNLLADNQEYLSEHRWPPVWFLKDFDYYEKCVGEREAEEKKLLKRRAGSGCLSFLTSKPNKQENTAEVLLDITAAIA